jgi:hypothetical protein
MSNLVSDDAWCQDETLMIEHAYEANAMIQDRRKLALEIALEIYACFGWNDAPTKELEATQQQHFGPPVHLP